MTAYLAPAVTIQTAAEISPMLNVQVNCAGDLYFSDDCKLAIADLVAQGGAYLRDDDPPVQPRVVAMNLRH